MSPGLSAYSLLESPSFLLSITHHPREALLSGKVTQISRQKDEVRVAKSGTRLSD